MHLSIRVISSLMKVVIVPFEGRLDLHPLFRKPLKRLRVGLINSISIEPVPLESPLMRVVIVLLH
jgi:hypothetical protein